MERIYLEFWLIGGFIREGNLREWGDLIEL